MTDITLATERPEPVRVAFMVWESMQENGGASETATSICQYIQKLESALAATREQAVRECAEIAEREYQVRMANMIAAGGGSYEWGDPKEATIAQGHKSVTATMIKAQILALLPTPPLIERGSK